MHALGAAMRLNLIDVRIELNLPRSDRLDPGASFLALKPPCACMDPWIKPEPGEKSKVGKGKRQTKQSIDARPSLA